MWFWGSAKAPNPGPAGPQIRFWGLFFVFLFVFWGPCKAPHTLFVLVVFCFGGLARLWRSFKRSPEKGPCKNSKAVLSPPRPKHNSCWVPQCHPKAFERGLLGPCKETLILATSQKLKLGPPGPPKKVLGALQGPKTKTNAPKPPTWTWTLDVDMDTLRGRLVTHGQLF